MSRLTGKGAGSLADAYASIYEAKKEEKKKGEDCTAASEKTTHNCAKKVCHEQFGEGTCVHGQHSFPDENGFVSHYDVEFSHGIEKAVPVSEMKVLHLVEHPSEGHEGMYDGEQLTEAPAGQGYGSGVVGQVQRLGAKMFGDASAVNKAVSYERSVDALTKRRGAGNVPLGADGKPITSDQIAAETKRRRLADPNYKPGQGVDSGAKPVLGNNKPNPKQDPPKPSAQVVTAKNASGQQQKVTVGRKYDATLGGQKGTVTYDAAGKRTFTANKPAGGGGNTQPTGGNTSQPAKPKPVPTGTTASGQKFERRLPTRAELQAAQAARAAAPKVLSRSEIENRAVTAGVNASKPKPPAATAAPEKANALGNKASELAALQAKAKADTLKRSRLNSSTDLFDLVKGHLIDEGASEEEAMKKMISMTQEEILALAENRRAARAAGGYKDDSKKQTDPSKEGFTGISGSIKDIMRQNKEIEARNKKK